MPGSSYPYCQNRRSDNTSCILHRASYACVRTRFPTSAGAGQACCYHQAGDLIPNSVIGGGLTYRAHHLGLNPEYDHAYYDTASFQASAIFA